MEFGLAWLRHHPVWGHVVAVMAVSVASGVRFAADEWLPEGYPFLAFFPAVILTTFVAGLWPGITAAVLAGLSAWYFFIPPPIEGAAFAMGFYAGIVAVDIAIIHLMITTQERLDAERRRNADLARQTELMFSELQHRVSNNLQMISSLLTLQQGKVADPEARRTLEQARARVATLGRLHRALHDPSSQQVDMERYLTDLVCDILETSGAQKVRCQVSAQPVQLTLEKLVPMALITAELFSNALEHAFAGGRDGTVSITLRQHADEVHLVIRDDGPGLPADFDLETQESLGLRIVRALAGQIGGRIAMHNDGGAVATLAFQA